MTEQQRIIVKQTLPLFREHGETIAGLFYESVQLAHPELWSKFPPADQVNGHQAARFSTLLVTWIEHLGTAESLDEEYIRIAQRHLQTFVRPEHYPVLGRHFLSALKAVFGRQASPQVVDAWAAGYQAMSDQLIHQQERLQTAASPPAGPLP